MNKSIAIYCNANEKEGYGHFFRCYNLLQIHIKKPYNVVFYGLFDPNILSLIHSIGANFYKCSLRELIENKFDTNLLIVDTYLKEQFEVIELDNRYRTIYFDDFNILDFSSSDAVINFTLKAEERDYNSRIKFLGTKYFPYKKGLELIRKKNLIDQSLIQNKEINILIILSAIKLEHTRIMKFIQILDKLFNKCKFTIIGIPCFEIETESNNEFIYEDFINHIDSMYSKTDLIISGGGMVKYEAAFCAIPNFTWSINKDQDKETKVFENYYLTYSIGSYFEFDEILIINKIKNYFTDKELQKKMIQNSQIYFDQSGINDLALYLNS